MRKIGKLLKLVVAVILISAATIMFSIDYTLINDIKLYLYLSLALASGIGGLYLLGSIFELTYDDLDNVDASYLSNTNGTYRNEDMALYARLGNAVIDKFNDDRLSDDMKEEGIYDLVQEANNELDSIRFDRVMGNS